MHLSLDKINDFNAIVYNTQVMQNYSTSFFPSKHIFLDLVSNADYEFRFDKVSESVKKEVL